jgi:hypothetical protein
MANESGLSKLVSRDFNAGAAKRARIDARTVGYVAEDDPDKIVWMGMSPAPGKGDGWYVIRAEEEPNEHLAQVNKGERIVQIVKVLGTGPEGPLSFEKAIEHLAVWEFSSMLKGVAPLESQNREALGKHYFKDLLMRRGYLVTTTGTLVATQDILPANVGKFLKTDLDALEQYRDGLKGENILNELIQSHDPIFISETALEDDLESFGDIGLFDKMRTFTDILVHYAEVKLAHVQEFYADPTRKETVDLPTRLAQDGFFSKESVEKFNQIREELAWSIFRYFHVAEEDWDKGLDFNSPVLRKELLKNPDAQDSHNYLTRKVNYPLKADDVDTMLFVSSRALIYFRAMLEDSPQKDALERKGIYRQGDIDDLLNYLDLLDIKYQYKELAEAALALPGTARYKELSQKKDAFKQRIQSFKDNLKSGQDYSPAMEAQVDGFIRASTPIYLHERIAKLPEKVANAQKYIMDRLLPKAPAAPVPPPPPETGSPGKKFNI